MSNTLSPSELGSFLDAVASAPVALRDVPRINSILARLVGLANSTGPIGVVPDEAEMRRKYIQEAAAKPAADDPRFLSEDEHAAATAGW